MLQNTEIERIERGNKGKLPFENAEWRPVPRSIATRYKILSLRLEVSNFGAVVTPKGLVRAHSDVVEKWREVSGRDSLKLYTDFSSAVSVHCSKDGPVLRLASGRDISLKRIVAEAFLDNPLGKPCVAVLNGDKLDLRADNLMYMSRAEINAFTRDGVVPMIPDEKPDLTYGFTSDGRYDYASRIFRIYGVSLREYNGILNAIPGPKGVDCAKLYFFIRYWERFGSHDFSGEDLSVHLGVSSKTVYDAVDLLIKAGLLTYDKELWRKRQGSYEYFTEECPVFDCGGVINLAYPCRGTRLDEQLVVYVKSLRSDVFEPEFKEEWNGMNPVHPEYYYESKYGELKYRYTTDANDMTERLKESLFVAKCVSNLRKPYSYAAGRCWPAFARSNREYRRGFEYEGSPLTELFDLHCSFYTLLTHLLGDAVPEEEKRKYFGRCITGKLYDDCMKFMNKGKRKNKVTRDEVKDYMQAWRNDITGNNSSKGVQDFMEDYYPNIKRVIDNWTTFDDKTGTHKSLQRDCGAYETRLMSELAYELSDKYGVSCFLLHDAIYISEREKAEKLPVDIEKRILTWFETKVLG